MPLELFLVFCSKHAQSTTLGLKLKFWMVSRHYVAAPDPLRNHFLFGRDEHAQIITLGRKLLLDTSMHFYIAFDNS